MAINKTLGNLFKGDKVIWMVFFFLCLISAIEVFSASSSLTYKGGSYLAPIVKHLGILFLGIVFMVFTVNIPCRYFKVYAHLDADIQPNIGLGVLSWPHYQRRTTMD